MTDRTFPRRSPRVEARLDRAGLGDLLERVLAGQPLGRDHGLRLYAHPDLPGVGYLANLVRERLHGDRTYWVRDHHLNPTNVCRHACTFCAFARRRGGEGAYELDRAEIVARAEHMAGLGVREVHVVGGVHPDWGYDVYLDVLRALRERLPRGEVGIKGWTAIEVDHMARLSGHPLERVLLDLREAGLDHLAGGGAEIFAPEVRRRICASKADGARWLEVHRTAHALGIPSNATMLYGHIEGPEHRVDHLLALRAVQAAAPAGGGFSSFIPLAFHPENTRLSQLPGPSGRDKLREVAVARLLLDGVPHVKAYWVMIGPDVAQLALAFGADDLHGTVVEERITHDAGARTEQGLTPARLEALIRGAGREPVERDTFYRPARPRAGAAA